MPAAPRRFPLASVPGRAISARRPRAAAGAERERTRSSRVGTDGYREHDEPGERREDQNEPVVHEPTQRTSGGGEGIPSVAQPRAIPAGRFGPRLEQRLDDVAFAFAPISLASIP